MWSLAVLVANLFTPAEQEICIDRLLLDVTYMSEELNNLRHDRVL